MSHDDFHIRSTYSHDRKYCAKNKLRVGYVLKRFPRFSETFIVNEILELERQGVDITVFSLLHPPEEKRHQFLAEIKAPVFYLPRQRATRGWSIDRIRLDDDEVANCNISSFEPPLPMANLFHGKSGEEVARLMLQATSVAMMASHFGIVHLHAHFASNATTIAMLASRLTDIPFSFTAHARDIYHRYVSPEIDDRLRETKILAASFVATVSDYNCRHLQRLVPVSEQGRVRRLYNGIDLVRFAPVRDRDVETQFIAVGRLVEKKGFRDLIEACHTLHASGHDFKCTIVGDGPLEGELSRQIRSLSLDRVVTLTGALTQDSVRDLINQATAMVLPCVITSSGDRDGLPTVLLEAMALGVAAISTSIAGIPEIIEDGTTGYVVAPNDIAALAEAMAALIVNPLKAHQLGANGRIRAERLFDRERNVAQLADWFRESACGSKSLKQHSRERTPHAHCLYYC